MPLVHDHVAAEWLHLLASDLAPRAQPRAKSAEGLRALLMNK